MKPSSGRAPSAATLAATVLCGIVLIALPGAAAHAQVSTAVADGTPQIDASIAARNWTEALAQLDARIASNPRDAQAKFKRGTVLARLNRDSDAIQQFTELTQTYPELPEPYNNLATLYAKEGRYDEARAALETAVKVNPSYGLAYENLGDLYLRLASESYKRAQMLGRASGATSQRLADIQKIVSPVKTTKRALGAAARAASSAAVTSPAYQSPTLQFGGPSGSLATPPYVAPSR